MAHLYHAADRQPETNSSTPNYWHPQPVEGRPPETYALQQAHSCVYPSRNQEASAYSHAASPPMAQPAPDSHSEYIAYKLVCQPHCYSSHPQTAHPHTKSQDQVYETYEEKKGQSASRVGAGTLSGGEVMAEMRSRGPCGRPSPDRVGAGVAEMRRGGPCGRPLSERSTPAHYASLLFVFP